MSVGEKTFGIDDLDELASYVLKGDFEALENARVAPDTRKAPKRWSRDLNDEWKMLLRQFGSGSALAFSVILMTPLLRRKIDFDKNFDLFHRLLSTYQERLLKELTTRWLVSICDTFILNPRTEEERAWAFAGAFFMKTIKLYETEELRLPAYPDLAGEVVRVDVDRMHQKHGRVMLFDGIQPFHLGGNGDMIDKMRARLFAVGSEHIAYRILCELYQRAHEKETVYRRIQKHVAQLNKAKSVSEGS